MEEAQPAPTAGDAAHLLVVDDDARLRALLQRFLSEQGFRVSTAPDAAAARASLAAVEGFRRVMRGLMGPDARAQVERLERASIGSAGSPASNGNG